MAATAENTEQAPAFKRVLNDTHENVQTAFGDVQDKIKTSVEDIQTRFKDGIDKLAKKLESVRRKTATVVTKTNFDKLAARVAKLEAAAKAAAKTAAKK